MYQLLRKRLAGKKGFTLIELIIVIAIIAILAVVLIPRFTGFTTSAREKSALSDARNVLMALEAIDAEAKWTASMDQDTVEAYLGKDLEGTLSSISKNTSGGINFTYSRSFGSDTITVYCNDGTLSASPAPTSTST